MALDAIRKVVCHMEVFIAYGIRLPSRNGLLDSQSRSTQSRSTIEAVADVPSPHPAPLTHLRNWSHCFPHKGCQPPPHLYSTREVSHPG